MARSPRRTSGSSLASTVNSVVVVCLAVAVAALGRIRLKSEENRAYIEINRLDLQLQELRRSNRKLQVDYEILTSSAGLSARIRDMRLNLVMPGDDARVVLPEPAIDRPTSTASGNPSRQTTPSPATLAMSPAAAIPWQRKP